MEEHRLDWMEWNDQREETEDGTLSKAPRAGVRTLVCIQSVSGKYWRSLSRGVKRPD